MYNAVEVAWKMLQIAKGKDIKLSNLQLQKLVYIAHGYMLGWKNKPLISDSIEAWKYGPVIGSIYHAFKGYKASKIPTDNIGNIALSDLDADAITCIEGVLDMYGKEQPEKLIAATHQTDTPWYDAWEVKNGKDTFYAEMDNESIRQHYLRLITDPQGVKGL